MVRIGRNTIRHRESPQREAVYPTLEWSEDEGLIRGEETDGKKVFSITDAGLEFLDENETIVEDISDSTKPTVRPGRCGTMRTSRSGWSRELKRHSTVMTPVRLERRDRPVADGVSWCRHFRKD